MRENIKKRRFFGVFFDVFSMLFQCFFNAFSMKIL